LTGFTKGYFNLRWALFILFFSFILAFNSPANSQCVYNFNSGQACTFVQSPTVDNCTTSSSAPTTEGINQFYSYGASGVSVLYCGGSTAGGNASPQVITMQCAPPAGATIVKAVLDVVEYNGSSSSPTYTTGAVVLGGKTTAAGIVSGYGNLWNVFNDPRYGYDVKSYPNQTAWNVRSDVTGQVALGTTSYTVTYPNIGANTAWSASLAIVYTVPAPNVCSAVALDDGLYYWDLEHDNPGSPLNEGVTPYAPTLDWSCSGDTSTTCGTNNFSVFGGSQYGLNNQPSSPQFLDQFYGSPSGSPVAASFTASEWYNCNTLGTCGQTTAFDQSYANVPLSGTQKMTWGLGNAIYANGKQEYWVNMLAASCAASCITPTPTPTRSPTPTSTATKTNTLTFTSTSTSTNTSTNTATSTSTATATATATATSTSTSTKTSTSTSTSTSTNSSTSTSTS